MFLPKSTFAHRRAGDERAPRRAVRADDEAAHQKSHAALRATVLGGGDDASHVLPSPEGETEQHPISIFYSLFGESSGRF